MNQIERQAMTDAMEEMLKCNQADVIIDNRTRVLLFAFRQALLMILGAIEDYMQIERSVVPKRKQIR